MMPTARRKLALFTGRGVDNNPRTGIVGPASTAPAPVGDTGHNTLLPKLQPPLQISRQQPPISTAPNDQFHAQQQITGASRSIPLPKAGRYTVTSMQPSRNAWDDSTVNSLFSDGGGSRAASTRHRGHQEDQNHQNHRREYNSDVVTYQRGQQQQAPSHLNRGNMNQRMQHDENLPFVIGENGLLKVVTAPGDHHIHGVTAALNATLSNNLMDEQTVKLDELYQEDRQVYDSPPPKFAPLRRTKLPHREATKRTSFSDAGGAGYSSDVQSNGMSPEKTSEAGEEIERVRQAERVRRDREREKSREVERQQFEREAQLERQRERERELQNKRSTMFENLTPVDLEDPASFNNTRAAVAEPDSEYTVEDALQCTPRAGRQTHPRPGPTKGINLFNEEGPLVRNSSHRLDEPDSIQQSLKRHYTPDYDDGELNKMSYSDLRNQDYDYDPQSAAAMAAQQQTTAGSAVGTIEERMQHYKTKGSMDQHQFFTSINAKEWDQAGDWFLEQFAGVVQKMRAARGEKRKLVEAFEEEIAQREEAVRGKTEGIERTLEDLKQEGQTMMAGKDMDLEA